ncbi:MAG TPA: farnesyl diphosphate synthase [Thermohalobaculum sp.]|nr:farnesyl diphosphate synthase [Thermohalobaculum sp.]
MTRDDPQFAEALSRAAGRAEAVLRACLPAGDGGSADAGRGDTGHGQPGFGEAGLRAAMRYAVLDGGKRLRAFLAIEVAQLFGAGGAGGAGGVGGAGAERVAAAVECLHAYSLVHDDLPSMDDDDLRRGKPTVHRVWDEATAVLAGDALQALAFEILADPATHPDGAVRARLVLRLAQAAGHAGMVCGQAIDLAAEGAREPLGGEAVRRLQALKTGALIEFAAEAGAIVAQAAEADIARIRAYARALGEAFQIADDLLDVTGDEAALGKRSGKDAAAGKATFVDILGVGGARARAAELAGSAVAELAPYGERAALLAAAARFVVERRS